MVRSPRRRLRKSSWKRKRRMKRRRETGRGVAHPRLPLRITSSSFLTALTPVVRWGSPCTGLSIAFARRDEPSWSLLTHIPLSRSSSALSQPGDIPAKTNVDAETPSPDEPAATGAEAGEAVALPGPGVSGSSSANDMLCTSQTLDDEPLTPEVVAPPTAVVTPRSEGMC